MFFFRVYRKEVIVGVLCILIMVLFGYVGIALRSEIRQYSLEEYEKSMREAEEKYDSGDTKASIALFRELISSSANQDDYGTVNMRLKLAGSLFGQNEPGNREEAVRINKSIILDPGVSLSMRAVAVNDMLDYYNGNQDRDFAKKVIFQEEPFGSFLEEGDLNRAMLRAYRYSDSLYPTPIASFRIARYLIISLKNDGAQLNEEEKESLYTEAEKRTMQGEDLLGKVFTTKNSYKKTKISAMYLLDAKNRAALGELSSNETRRKSNTLAAILAFQKSLEILAPEDTPSSYIAGLYSRFYHAAFLARAFGEKNADEIKILLEPIVHTPPRFVSLSNNPFDGFLVEKFDKEYRRSDPEKDIMSIVAAVPEFKEALKSRGIDISLMSGDALIGS